MRSADATQFSIRMQTKNALDRFKAKNKEKILIALKKKRRHVSNDDAVSYLLSQVK